VPFAGMTSSANMLTQKAILLPQTGMSLIVLCPKHTVQGTSENALGVVVIVTLS
jgi:hypothetical protein